MKELIKKQYEECRKAYESLTDKTSEAALQLLGAMGAYEMLCPELKEKSPYINSDEVREDFIREVYRILDADPNNDRANQIIDVFDNLPTVKMKEPVQWKPTAAQIYALKEKLNEGIYSGRCSELSSLYHDLIKLL